MENETNEETIMLNVIDEETTMPNVIDEETTVLNVIDEETTMLNVIDEETTFNTNTRVHSGEQDNGAYEDIMVHGNVESLL